MIVNRHTAMRRTCLLHCHVSGYVQMSKLFNIELYLSGIFYFSICFLTSHLHKQDKFYATVLYLKSQLSYSSPNRLVSFDSSFSLLWSKQTVIVPYPEPFESRVCLPRSFVAFHNVIIFLELGCF